MKKKGQQEIAGFLIIVILVILAIFIFVITYLSNKKDTLENKEVEVLLQVLLKTTTGCHLEGNNPSDLKSVFIDAYNSFPKKCKNSEKSSREYLEEYIPSLMNSVLSLETNFEGYIIEIIDENSGTIIKSFSNSNCAGKEMRGAEMILKPGNKIFMRVC